MAKLFVSYSRKDSTAARKLIEAFKSMGQEVWVDWEAIPPAVDWLEQIFRGIEEADAFIFMISPDSIISEVCKVEVGRAVLNNKRIIPIVLRDVDPSATHAEIRKLNWTFLRETDDPEEGLAKVKTAIELDLDWLEEHRRLQVRALEWHRKKDVSLLLYGRDLRNARHMVQTYTAKDPIPTDLQLKYIEFSQRRERTQRIMWGVTAVTVLIMIALTFIAVNRSNEALIQQQLAKANEAKANDNAVIANQERQKAEANEKLAKQNEALAKQNEALAKENEILAKAQRSAARAQIFQSRTGELYTSTLLAIDSMQKVPSEEAEEILRKNISLLPRPVAQASQSGTINELVFSPESDTFVTASADGTACLWRLEDGTNLFCTPSGQPTVNAAAFSPDGRSIAIGDQSGRVQILNAGNGDIQHVYQRVRSRSGSLLMEEVSNGSLPDGVVPQEIPVLSLQFRPPNGQQVAAAYEDGEIPVFDPNTGKVSSPLLTGSRPNVFGFSQNGQQVAAGNENGRVSVWTLGGEKITSPTSHRKGVLAMAFSRVDGKLATAGNDKQVAISSLRTGEELLRFSTQSPVRSLAFSPDGTWLVTAADDHRIRIWDSEDGSERLAMSQDGAVSRVVVSPNGQWLGTTGDDRTARVWDAVTGAEIFQVPLSASGTEVAFSSDGNYFVTTDQAGAIDIWDVSALAARLAAVPFNGGLNRVQYSPSGEWLAVSNRNQVWLLRPNPETGLVPAPQGQPALSFKSDVVDLVFSPDSRYLGVSTAGKELAYYDLQNRVSKPLGISSLVKIVFSPDSQQLIASGTEGGIQAWEVSSAKPVEGADQKYPQASSLASSSRFWAFGSQDRVHILGVDENGGNDTMEAPGENTLLAISQDGSLLAATDSSGQVHIWKVQDGQFKGLTPFLKEQAASMAFNADGSRLALGTAKNVLLIDTASGKEVARIPHRDQVTGVSFSPDGKYLATASSNVLQFWDLARIEQIKSEELIRTACSRLIGKFSDTQLKALFDDAGPSCSSLQE